MDTKVIERILAVFDEEGCDEEAAAIRALSARVEELKAAIRRIGRPEAFFVATSSVDPETYARMIFADKILEGTGLAEADRQTEVETKKRYLPEALKGEHK